MKNMPSRAGGWRDGLKWLLLLCVFMFGVAGMTMKGGSNIFLFLMTLLSLPLLTGFSSNRWSWLLFGILSSSLLVTGLQLALKMPLVSYKAMDAPSRFFLAAICLLALQQLDAKRLAGACWGIWLGAIGVMVWGYVSTHVPQYYWGDGGRGWNQFSNPIPFGVYAIILGSITLLLPQPKAEGWRRHAIRGAKVFGFLGGVVAAYYSGSRAPFMVLPPLMIIAALVLTRWSMLRTTLVLGGVFVLMSTLVMMTPNKIHERVNEGLTDIQVFHQDQNTSMGLRWVMWSVAKDIIVEHPIAGVGKQGYYDEVNARFKQGKAPAIITAAPHPHNELLNFGVEMGVVGIVLGVLLFATPAALFLSRLNAADEWIRFAASAGSMVVVGQFTASLLDTYFWIVSQTAFYGVWVVVSAAIILARERELAGR